MTDLGVWVIVALVVALIAGWWHDFRGPRGWW